MNSTTMRSEDDDLLAIGLEEPRMRAAGRRRGKTMSRHAAASCHRCASVMAAPTVSGVASLRANSATMRPPFMTSTRSLMPSTSGNSLEIIRMARPFCASLRHQRMDLRFGADIDAARRLVHDEDARLGGEPFGEHDLLLIAARQLARRLRRVRAP